MKLAEADMLRPWLEVGVDVLVVTDSMPNPILAKKRYLVAVEGGYALTEMGRRQGECRVAHIDSSAARGEE